MRTFIAATGFVLATAAAALGVPNIPTLYPDGSYRYRYGWPGFDVPVVFATKGSICTIELNEDESLPPANANPVVISDSIRWHALTSRGGGARLANGKAVPFEWTVSVQPMNDAGDARLLIHTTMGRRYMIHLVAVDQRDSRGEALVGFYPFHPIRPAARPSVPRRQARPPAIQITRVVYPTPPPAVATVTRPIPAPVVAPATPDSTLSSILAAPKAGLR